MADFTWCLIALSWGHTIEDTAAKLVETRAQQAFLQHLSRTYSTERRSAVTA
jgi:hypothetical protein